MSKFRAARARRRAQCGPAGRYLPGTQPIVDRWTLVHALFGLAYGALGLPFGAVAALAIGWELLENPLKDRYPRAFPDACHDSLPNAAVDAGAVVAAWALVRRRR